ncbi:Hsp70 family protein [Dictyobacter kobayashii]|uniref:Molecular chaperone DnaK n=1 Tax=Dictyobacter kobayashii TaxID=2014872 RepID=A0A402AV63_9CHLR|nr:Hsp70 family protein [Dictyobacter kobayashii]GCE22975.1 molecular chaperone DnaK [Dictyobacter kobayashii]
MGRFVGIDLGTTYSAIAFINGEGRAEVIKNSDANAVTPSIIWFDGSRPVVGEEAREQMAAGATEIALLFKRHMGDPDFLLAFGDTDYIATDLAAIILRYLKKCAEDYLGESVTDAVITVPAYFKHAQRSATIEAGHKAGLNVLQIISEPTAAALAYGQRPGPNTQEQLFLVYDLGGGTFDVSLVAITPTELKVIGTDGDDNLGGKDWDDSLLSHLEAQFEQEFGLELFGDDVNALRVQAEELKRKLSARQSATIRVQASGQVGSYTVTREQFERMTQGLMERTQFLTERVLRTAGKSWADITGVLPVGGSTRMPMVSDYIKRMSGNPPMGGIHPDEAVAIGAAIQAAMSLQDSQNPATENHFVLRAPKHTVDVIAHSLGLIAESADRTRYINSMIIPKNNAIPTQQMRPFELTLRRDGNTELEVFLTQGETQDPQQCSYLGRYIFSRFPHINSKTAILNITYAYDKNGTVTISATERTTGQPLALDIQPVPTDVPARFLRSPLEQQVPEEIITVYLDIDTSGSMAGRPLREAKKAAHQFVQQCDLSRIAIGLISFSSFVHVPLHATQDASKISRAIDSLSSGGGTSGGSLNKVYNLLHDTVGPRYAVVLTDGAWMGRLGAIMAAQRCHKAEIQIIAIGFGRADHSFLRAIASSNEQSFFTDLGRLSETFSTIAREITMQR